MRMIQCFAQLWYLITKTTGSSAKEAGFAQCRTKVPRLDEKRPEAAWNQSLDIFSVSFSACRTFTDLFSATLRPQQYLSFMVNEQKSGKLIDAILTYLQLVCTLPAILENGFASI